MAFRTEMGLYFSYYKTIVNADSFSNGLYEVTNDNMTEYGHTINTLKRFNLYPEVILSFLFRNFKRIAETYDWKVENCWQVNRGPELPPVQGCEGIGNLHYFYIDNVFILAGTVAGCLFLLGVIVSDSIFGGLISVAAFFFNHGEATRVQWTPPLRESFGFPMIIAQITVLSYILRNNRVNILWPIALGFFTVGSMLFWQFSQFAFFTQIGSLFIVYVFDFIQLNTIKTILKSHLVSFICSFFLLFGNEMLLTAFYFPSILALILIICLEPLLNRLTFRPLYVLLSTSIFVGTAIGLKIMIASSLQVEDDAHIIDILRSKFSSFSNFHTRLYTCSAEFDFMKMETVQKLFMSVLIPSAILGCFVFILYFLLTEFKHILWRDINSKGKPYAEIFYNLIQLACYSVMALLIMRLKLFFTPHLCVLGAVLANQKLIQKYIFSKFSRMYSTAFVILLISAMAFEGRTNLEKQLAIRGEFSNPDQELLFNWIIKNTKKDAVFAGTMPVMANVKLSTGRPIVNHPHYEDVGIRNRTLNVYSVFSKKPLKEVHNTLKDMGVNYFVFQLFNCAPDANRPYCAYRGMWDEHDPQNVARKSNCDLYHQAVHSRDDSIIKPFSIAYTHRGNYIVLKV
ncbi:unnamed protein product [Auanema sp. JU1783]|nr:unnamed protein product [Auanema sp. JU1783]